MGEIEGGWWEGPDSWALGCSIHDLSPSHQVHTSDDREGGGGGVFERNNNKTRPHPWLSYPPRPTQPTHTCLLQTSWSHNQGPLPRFFIPSIRTSKSFVLSYRTPLFPSPPSFYTRSIFPTRYSLSSIFALFFFLLAASSARLEPTGGGRAGRAGVIVDGLTSIGDRLFVLKKEIKVVGSHIPGMEGEGGWGGRNWGKKSPIWQ